MSQGRGILVALEGIHASGKSLFCRYLLEELEKCGLRVTTTKWNSTPILNEVIQKMKELRMFTPRLWSYIHLSEFAYRYDTVILPALDRGEIVVCDRYIYTALTRDTVRGLSEEHVRSCYSFAREPDLVIYFDVAVGTTLKRRTFVDLMYYSSGMDVTGLPMEESYIVYQELLRQKYQQVLRRVPNLLVITEGADYRERAREVRDDIVRLASASATRSS